ncbi:GlxA family transcriptional regulator [uncultured Lentibacter sp.]|jgi:transcriptional regulator GlxA family with amidase domain|uniref:GlxA family transcriptional regulator n=1 Tax=uncultured Lentibacter sp. TaxID=1659309 RepID=UPI00263957A0|nr:helix-turn-helix domain-containing protein [uncultured Lentibacter sp.]
MQIWKNHDAAVQQVDVLLFEAFSGLCLANTIEPLRAANTLSGRVLYRWRLLTLDGAPVLSSSGMSVAAHGALSGLGGDMLIVMPSYGFASHAREATARGLRAAAGRYEVLAGFDTGSWLLAHAGLLNGRRATIHWEELERFGEAFPDVQAERARFVEDGDRVTCSGAQAAFDVMTHRIGARHGQALRLELATLFMSPDEATPQDVPMARARSVVRAIRLMQAHVEQPLPMGEIARRAGRAQKDLEVRMKRELGATPRAVYRRIRLLAARKLLKETALPITEVALRAGYQDASAMTRAYRAEFGLRPRDERKA